jgi:lactoylglutathione lyase
MIRLTHKKFKKEQGINKIMKFKMIHENYNVTDLERSLQFYREALGLTELHRKESADGSYVIVYIGNNETTFELELTWLRDHEGAYNLGENEFHLAFATDNFAESYRKHKEMGCICYENPDMGVYFIIDPDGYWLEIVNSSES